MIKVKRAYDPPEPADGARYLVDRLWPRGIKKEALQLTDWPRAVAPSDELRKWYHRDLDKWDEFVNRYRAELDGAPEACQPLLEAARQHDITLIYASKIIERNNATVLKEYLEERLREGG
jgi:uncharacterized protein YeaO (DUF488 family)